MVRNVFACLGIEAKYVSGSSLDGKPCRTRLEPDKIRWELV